MPLFFWIGTPKDWLHFFRTIYVEEKVAVFLSSRERHINVPFKATKTSENKPHEMKETQRAKYNSSYKTICWSKD